MVKRLLSHILLKQFITFFAFVFIAENITAQAPAESFIMEHFTDETGLPQNSIKDMLLSENYLWICTEAGLVQFNGHEFTTYTSREIAGLKSNRFLSISKGPADTIFAFAEGNQVVIVKQNTVVVVPYNRSLHHRYGNFDRYPVYFIPEKNPSPRLSAEDMPFAEVYDTLADRSIIMFRKSIAWYEKKVLQSTADMPDGYDRTFLARSGKFVFYLTSSWELWRMSPSGHEIVRFAADEIPLKSPQFLWADRSGNLYGVTEDAIYGIEPAGHSTGKINKICAVPQDSHTSAVLRREDGTVIVGTINKGLFIFHPTQFKVVGGDLLSATKASSVYYAQTILPAGTLLSSYGTYFTPAGITNGLATMPLLQNRTLLTDSEGYTWYSHTDSLFRQALPKGNREFVHAITGILKVLFSDTRENIWIATTDQISCLKDRVFTTLIAGESFRKLLAEVDYIEEEDAQHLLIGSQKGLFRFSITDNSFQLIDGTEGMNVRFIKKDANKIWFSTYGHGFALLQNNQITFFPMDKNAYLQFSHGLVEDKKGYFWIPTNKGLFQVLKKELETFAATPGNNVPYYYCYNATTNGFKTNEFNGGCQPAYVQMTDGRISLPSMNGLLWFDPLKVNPELPDKPVYLSTITLNGNSSFDPNHPVKLPRRFSALQFSFSSAFWGSIENEYWEYRLTGESNTGWLKMTENKSVLIGQLEGGNYNLEIRKRTGFGENSFHLYSKSFRVEKFFYETNLFYVLVLAGVVTVFFAGFSLRNRFLRKQRTKLRQQVKKRTAQLEESIEQLNDKQRELEDSNYIKNKLISILSHDITTPLQFISLISVHLQRSKTPDPAELKTGLKRMQQSSEQLVHLADDLLNWMKAQDTSFVLVNETIPLAELVNEKIAFFSPQTESQFINISNLISGELVCNSNRRLLGIILHNIISNAVKFTLKGGVWISAETLSNHTRLTVEDTGIGMTAEKLLQVQNAIEYPVEKSQKKLMGKGIGLMLIYDLARILNVGIEYSSQKGVGTKVTVIIYHGTAVR